MTAGRAAPGPGRLVTAGRPGGRGLRGSTVADALDGALTALTAAGVDTPRLDAEVLLAWAIGTSRAGLISRPDAELEPDAARAFRDAVTRRARDREPVAYITGRRGFRHLELAVDPRVLIPRPETETLVEAALDFAGNRTLSVVDVGTGSGAVALALAQEAPAVRVVGSDTSAPALEVARANASRLGLAVDFVQADLLGGELATRRIDLVVSNPPYVADGDRSALAPEITRHEPAHALFAGPDGLDVIRVLIDQAANRDDVGTVALEVGDGQAATVAAMLGDAGFAPPGTGGAPATRRDLAGAQRVVVGSR